MTEDLQQAVDEFWSQNNQDVVHCPNGARLTRSACKARQKSVKRTVYYPDKAPAKIVNLCSHCVHANEAKEVI